MDNRNHSSKTNTHSSHQQSRVHDSRNSNQSLAAVTPFKHQTTQQYQTNTALTNHTQHSDEMMYSQSAILEENAFVLNNYDIIESVKSQGGSVTTYVGSSFFDNEFYMIKRKRLENTANDNEISNKEQSMLQSLQNDGLSKYVMSFYLNRSIYVFFTASQHTLRSIMPIKNQRKSLSYFIQVCKAVQYLHDKKLVIGNLSPQTVFIHKTKAFLAINSLFDTNKGIVKFKQQN